MIIRSMTATFGKLEHQTLALKPGLNILQAPNEWGKSTWCAFVTAMLYGIETRVHSTKSALADKERYAPWSGSPMAGRMDLVWQGREITIERRSKGRGVFNQFRAYETESGLDIPQLTGANCGLMLTGVERSVFARSCFLRLADLPVTQDEALQRRLHSLVTTGDESGSAHRLQQQLRDLKNRCRLNRATGLLPQAEARRQELRTILEELDRSRQDALRHRQRLDQLETHRQALENHRSALEYEASRSWARKLEEARTALEDARLRLQEQEARCASLPAPEQVDRTLLRLQQLRDTRDALLLEAQLLSPAPEDWEPHPAFRDLPPQDAPALAATDAKVYGEDSQKRPFPWYWLLLALAGIGALALSHWLGKILGAAAVLAGLLLFSSAQADRRRRQATAQAIRKRYDPLPPEEWVPAAEEYARRSALEAARSEKYREDRAALDSRLRQLDRELDSLTEGRSLAGQLAHLTQAREAYSALSGARREHRRAAELVQTLADSHRQVQAPGQPDTMTYTAQETARLLSDCAAEQRQLQLLLGNVQGRMEAMGSEEDLRQELNALNQRIRELEDTCAALELAMDTLSQAEAQLQRRFAPKISRRTQELFSRLTGDRYNRLTLSEDLTLQVGAAQEDTLRSVLWRSDGTGDQLYLALRLAVTEALAPTAPLILDDALVRFDDTRLAQALAVLSDEAKSRQVILFTCQDRENRIVNG